MPVDPDSLSERQESVSHDDLKMKDSTSMSENAQVSDEIQDLLGD